MDKSSETVSEEDRTRKRGKPWRYKICTGRNLPAHIVNPQTRRTFCQAENNATWPMWKHRTLPVGVKECRNCLSLEARANG